MRNVTIFHCWEGTPESNWYPWLKKDLERKGYKVNIPLLMDNMKPTLEYWMNCANPDENIDAGDVIIGHSLGAVFALRVAEKSKVKIGHLILVSGWDFWDLTPEFVTFFNPLMEHDKIVNNCEKITVVHSSNDPFITIFQAEEMSKRLNADFVKIENGGHLTADDGYNELPKLLEII